jgi:hypothetical protein
MIKVRILDRCEFCDDEAYIFVCGNVDSRGETYERSGPHQVTNASGGCIDLNPGQCRGQD